MDIIKEVKKIVQGLLASVYQGIKTIGERTENLVEDLKELTKKLTPDIPHILSIEEIKDLTSFIKENFSPTSTINLLKNISQLNSVSKTRKSSALTDIITALKKLNTSLKKNSEHLPKPYSDLLTEMSNATDRTAEVVKIVDSRPGSIDFFGTIYDVEEIIKWIETLVKEIDSMDWVKFYDSMEDYLLINWQPKYLTIVMILDVVMGLLKLAGEVAPITVDLGAGGGVAAGINAHGKVSVSTVSLGKLTFGSLSSILSIIKTLITYMDSQLHLQIKIARLEALNIQDTN